MAAVGKSSSGGTKKAKNSTHCTHDDIDSMAQTADIL
jgi:hypothetical protein